jgi:hypothetical protein
MRKILSFKDFGLYEYQKFDNSLYNKINEANFLDPLEKKPYNPDAYKRMKAAIFWLTGQHPFFSGLLAKLYIRENKNLRYKTMATDGFSIHYDPGYVLDHTEEEIMWVIAHEIMHNALLHFLRAPKDLTKLVIWNVATDYAINQMLTPVENGGPTSDRKKCVGTMPKGALYPGCGHVDYDKEFIGLPSEKIYNILISKGYKGDEGREPGTPPPKPTPGPPKNPQVGDVIYDKANDNYGVVNSVDENSGEIDYDPIPKDRVSQYLKKNPYK